MAACMFNLIDINKQEQDKVVETDKENVKNPDNDEEQEENKEAIAFCEANKDEIYKKIIENRNNSLAAKYDKELLENLYKISSKDDLNCKYASEQDYYYYFLGFNNSDKISCGVEYPKNLNFIIEYITTIDGVSEINEYFAPYIAVDIVGRDNLDKIANGMWYSEVLKYGEDYMIFSINANAGSELIALFDIDLKSKTYKRLK